MYDADSYYIPDSDAKIYMSLDDIIKLENIRKPGPGSVRSVASRRSNYSHKSHRSTYSTRSNRSRRSNYSARSNRSRRSTYSNWSNRSHHSALSNRSRRSGFGDQVVLSNSSAFKSGQTISRYRNPLQHLNHRNLIQPGIYNPKSQFNFYRNTVKNAVKRLTNRVPRQHLGRFGGHVRHYNNYSQKFLQRGNTLPRDISIEVKNRVHPLTKRSLQIFNESYNNRGRRNPRSLGTRTTFSNVPTHINYSKRHSVQGSINRITQKEILIVQKRAKSNSNSEDLTNMEFSPTPHFTTHLINDRFSSYD